MTANDGAWACLIARFGVGIILPLLSIAACDTAEREATRPQPLRELQHRTAWIYLGDVSSDDSRWATQPRSQFVTRVNPSAASVGPVVGDVLEMNSVIDLLILGYLESGEQNRRESPGGRPLTHSDRTGLQLPAGARVSVVDVHVEVPAGGLRGVFVRVVPVDV